MLAFERSSIDGSSGSGEVVRQLLAGRAAIDIVLGQINKIRFPKAACRLGARGLRLGQRDRDAGLFACQDFLTFKVAPAPQRRPSYRCAAWLSPPAPSSPVAIYRCRRW